MKGELLWPLHDDVVTSRVPSYHMMVFGFLEKTAEGKRSATTGGMSGPPSIGTRLTRRAWSRTCSGSSVEASTPSGTSLGTLVGSRSRRAHRRR